MDDKSWLSHAIQEVLPDLNNGKLLAITTTLGGIGVESKEDLPFVSAEDLDDLLPPIKTRKLLQGLKAKESDDRDQHDKELASVQQGTYTDDASLDTPHRPSNNWSSSYKVPWHKLPKALMAKCKVGERPEPRDRREMIKIIMDDVNGLHHLVKRKDLRKIAQDIVGKFSKSFADIINGEILGDGASSLLQQLESRKENLQRLKGCKRPKPAATATGVSDDLPARKKARIDLDSFGCIKAQWMPDLPEGESEDTQEEKKKFLQQEYEKSSWNIDSVHENMTATYSTQRHDIYDAKNIEDLFQQWPYLAEEKWLLNHFQCLTGIDLIERLSNAFVKKGSRLFMYLQTKKASGALVEAVNAIKTAVKVADNQRAVTAGLPVILAAYFKEEISVLIRCYNETATREQVQLDASLPATPCIAVLGELYSATRMFVIVDRKVINCAVTSLQKALLMTFACFYILNIEYGGEISSTLDFIQRFFVGINPGEGTKAVRGKKRGMQVSGKVIALANAMALFESEWNLSEL